MAKIDLGGDIRNTDKPMPHTVVNDNTGMAGIAATQRANDRLAAGMRHVSETVLGISMDMKRDEVNEETVNAQIEYYDRSQEALRRLSERRIYNQDEYKAAFNAEMDRVDSEMQKWAKENTSWGESRKALELISKSGRSRNFAQAMGGFLNAKAQRKAQVLEYNYNRLVEAGDIANVEVLLNASHLAPETREIWLGKAKHTIAKNNINLIRAKISTAASSEEVERLIGEANSGTALGEIGKMGKDAFDVFALANLNAKKAEEAANAEREKKKEEARKIAEGKQLHKESADKVAALRAGVTSAAAEMATKFGENAIDKNGALAALEDILKESNFSNAEKEKARAELNVHILEARAKATSLYKEHSRKQAFATLETAQRNDGFIGADEMKDDVVARARREADKQAEYNLLDDAKKLEYRGKFYGLLTEISRYNGKTDEDGTKLVELMKRAQTFPRSSRRELMHAIYDTANGIKPNETWTGETMKQFNEAFNELCTLGKNSRWFADDGDPALALDFRNRILTLARIRGLSLSDTIAEMKNDPFVKNAITAQGRENARNLIRQ